MTAAALTREAAQNAAQWAAAKRRVTHTMEGREMTTEHPNNGYPTEHQNNRYPRGTKVRVTDVGRGGRKYLGYVLHVERLADDNSPDAWAVELRNGNRGCYDIAHIEAA